MIEIYRAMGMPIFQNKMFSTSAEAIACPRGDIVIVQDTATGLLYNRAFDASVMAYDGNYQNEQAVSRAFVAHLEKVAGIVQGHMAGSIVEVGCGKAHFLEMLQVRGARIVGYDPAYEGTNPAVKKAWFNPAANLRGEGLVLRHVLEHIQDPIAFLRQLNTANGGAKIYIEVPCMDWIAEHNAWFDICYEHVNYFRLGDFDRMFGTVYESGRVFGGQYLYVVADLASLRTPGPGPKFSVDFAIRPKVGAIWGAATKGVIYALFMQRVGIEPDAVIDINPAKQGKYIAASGFRVDMPEEALTRLRHGATILIMNGNYLAEVQTMAGANFDCEVVD